MSVVNEPRKFWCWSCVEREVRAPFELCGHCGRNEHDRLRRAYRETEDRRTLEELAAEDPDRYPKRWTPLEDWSADSESYRRWVESQD